MRYHHVSERERNHISILRQAGHTHAEIGRQINRCKSTVSREIRRNSCPLDNHYRVEKAQARAKSRSRISRRNLCLTTEDITEVTIKIHQDWSPEQIAQKAARNGTLRISHESIYRLIREDKRAGGRLYTHLRCSRKLRRKRYGRYDSRGRLAGKRMIDERPDHINQRLTIGHWEADTVMGKGPDCLLTLVERKSRFTIIGKLNQHTVSEVNRVACQLLAPYRDIVSSITFDNGTEFHGYKQLEQQLDCTAYFAFPYHSWERGTNENTNGLIRQYLPKRTSMFGLTQDRCNQYARRLNTRPRKTLDYKTPMEVLANRPSVAL